ncbi:MAG: sugar ABC transporter ATP-binding protein [Paracoccaceae bacterium]|nr:sugar ABC transporter ATP-binding protein [Paracoccaceae bacterium]
MGENGAGKSTLGKVFGGYYPATAGRLVVFGQPVTRWDPPTALANGVAIMHQELQLVPEMTVAENVFLGLENERWGVLAKDEAERLEALMRSSGFALDPGSVVADLPIAEQQKIEILRALARDARVIVMDEPTSSLSKDEVGQLHEAMRTLRDEGRTVIYVSHYLEDILAVTDRVTVLRDGVHVRTGPTSDETRGSLVSAMLGRGKTETPFPEKVPPVGRETILDVSELGNEAGVRGASLTVGKGEIVGLIGLVGSGRSEIARAIIGADPARTGDVMIDGRPYRRRTVAESARRGLVMVPEDRRRQGLVMTMRVRANITLPHLARIFRTGMIRSGKELSRTRELMEYFRVRPADPDGDVSRFSGGNQQKVLFGKWLAEKPGIVILDEPSRGVDVGARERIHQAIAELAAGGTAILVISSEISEVLGLAHRAYLIDRGRTVEEIDPEAHSEATVLSALFRHQAESDTDPGKGSAAGTRTGTGEDDRVQVTA